LLAAVANSRLRVQADLVEWQHWRGNIMPEGAEKKAERETKDGSTGPDTGLPGANGTTGSGGPSESGEGLLPNLVRVVIYGRASLYGRYPPNPKAPATDATTTDSSTK
jgi:hypothetical protein